MGKSVIIRELFAPPLPLSEFDPGAYLSGLEFTETEAPITEEGRDGLAQMVQFLAFLALQAKSSKWAGSTVARGTLACQTLESHFGHLRGWSEMARNEQGLDYRQLAHFLTYHYPAHPPAAGPAEPGPPPDRGT
jgi:hypothetical protein